MQNESNAALGTGLHASEVSHEGIPAGQLSVAISTPSEPISKVVGIEDGTVVVTDTKDVVSNAPVKVRAHSTSGEMRQKPKFTTRDKGEGKERARQGSSLAGKANDRSTQRKSVLPARGNQMGAALGLALSSAGRSYEDFPKAPGKEQRKFPKAPNLKGQQKQHGRFTGKANTTHRSVNRGK